MHEVPEQSNDLRVAWPRVAQKFPLWNRIDKKFLVGCGGPDKRHCFLLLHTVHFLASAFGIEVVELEAAQMTS